MIESKLIVLACVTGLSLWLCARHIVALEGKMNTLEQQVTQLSESGLEQSSPMVLGQRLWETVNSNQRNY